MYVYVGRNFERKFRMHIEILYRYNFGSPLNTHIWMLIHIIANVKFTSHLLQIFCKPIKLSDSILNLWCARNSRSDIEFVSIDVDLRIDNRRRGRNEGNGQPRLHSTVQRRLRCAVRIGRSRLCATFSVCVKSSERQKMKSGNEIMAEALKQQVRPIFCSVVGRRGFVNYDNRTDQLSDATWLLNRGIFFSRFLEKPSGGFRP